MILTTTIANFRSNPYVYPFNADVNRIGREEHGKTDFSRAFMENLFCIAAVVKHIVAVGGIA